MKDKQALTTGDVARYCGVHFRTVTRWIQKGHLKAFHLPGRGDSRIFVHDFLEFLKSHNIDIPPEFREEAEQVSALIVEDDAPMARSIKRVLTGLGVNCEIAADGFRAGALINSLKPDLITLDLKMPGLGGASVLEIVRSLPIGKEMAILVISGMEEPALKKALSNGANAYLKKPFTKAQLEEKVREVLSSKKLGGSHEARK